LTPLPETCEREALALAVDYGGSDYICWQEVVSFACAYPGVPVLLIGADLDGDHVVPAALERTPNLVLELSMLTELDPLVRLMARFGEHRFVYGSGGDIETRLLPALRESERLEGSARIAVLAGNADAFATGQWAKEFL
jgi:hypothetical protein